MRIHKEEFVDDVALLASTREAAGIAVWRGTNLLG